MSEWREMPIGELMAEFHDGPHATPKPSVEGPVFLGIKNLTDAGNLDLSAVRHIAPEDFTRWTKRVTPQQDDIVFTYEATLHRYALIPRGFHGCLGRRLALIRPHLDRADPRYLHQALRSPAWRSTVEERVISGATVDRIPLIDFLSFPIRVPSLGTQRRVAAVLAAFDELIAINERRIELLEDLARSLYREWFVRFRFPESNHDSGPERLPVGWERRPSATVATFINGYAFKPSDWSLSGPPIIKIKELKQGVSDSTPRYSGDGLSAKFVVERGDLLFSWSAHLGVYLWPDEPGYLNQHLFKVTPGAGLTVEYLFHALDSAIPEFDARAQGTTMRHIKRSALTEVELVVPSVDVVTEFSRLVMPLHEQVLVLAHASNALAHTRDLLLPRLVTGHLDIADIDLGDLLPAETAA